MPAKSKAQQRLFATALSVKRGDKPRSSVSSDVLDIVDKMTEKDIADFASTDTTNLPQKKELSMKKSELRQLIREEIQRLTESTQEYYVPWSSWFDSNPYDIKKIKAAVKKAGAKNVKTERAFGWSNQPEVVVFQAKASDRDRTKIEDAVSKALGTPWVHVNEKDW